MFYLANGFLATPGATPARRAYAFKAHGGQEWQEDYIE
jgi:hypothetical protein